MKRVAAGGARSTRHMPPRRRLRPLALGVAGAALVLAAAHGGLLLWLHVRGGVRAALEPPHVESPRDGTAAAAPRYRWVDRDAGIAEIPVERALDLFAIDGGAQPADAASQPSAASGRQP